MPKKSETAERISCGIIFLAAFLIVVLLVSFRTGAPFWSTFSFCVVGALWIFTGLIAIAIGLASEGRLGILARFLFLGLFPISSMFVIGQVLRFIVSITGKTVAGDTGFAIAIFVTSLWHVCVAALSWLTFRYLWATVDENDKNKQGGHEQPRHQTEREQAHDAKQSRRAEQQRQANGSDECKPPPELVQPEPIPLNLPLNSEVMAAAAKVVSKALQAGTLNFAELMERMVTKYGEKMAERMRGALQQAWDQQVNSEPVGALRDERYYSSVLGLAGRITPDDVQRKYHDLSMMYHPDHVSHLGVKLQETAASEMKAINEAYDYFKKKYGM